MNYQNHVIDPTYFYDAIEEFSFTYKIHVVSNEKLDDYGNLVQTYITKDIEGSLQSDGTQERQSKEGNTQEKNYRFYCKSLYRINLGDIIEYKKEFLRVNWIKDYDEFGVREARLSTIKLTQYRDFADYIKYLNGEKLV